MAGYYNTSDGDRSLLPGKVAAQAVRRDDDRDGHRSEQRDGERARVAKHRRSPVDDQRGRGDAWREPDDRPEEVMPEGDMRGARDEIHHRERGNGNQPHETHR